MDNIVTKWSIFYAELVMNSHKSRGPYVNAIRNRVTGLFVPKTFRSQGTKHKFWTFRSVDVSFRGRFVPWSFRSSDVSFPYSSRYANVGQGGRLT